MGIDVAPERGQRHRPHATLDWYLCPDYVPWTCPPGLEEKKRSRCAEPTEEKKGSRCAEVRKKRRTPGPRATDHICVYYLCVAHIRYASATRTYTHREYRKKKRPAPRHLREKKKRTIGAVAEPIDTHIHAYIHACMHACYIDIDMDI